MAYTAELHANLGFVDKRYKAMLHEVCTYDKRTIKHELEHLIVQAYTQLPKHKK